MKKIIYKITNNIWIQIITSAFIIITASVEIEFEFVNIIIKEEHGLHLIGILMLAKAFLEITEKSKRIFRVVSKSSQKN